MINTLKVYEELKSSMEDTAAMKIAGFMGTMYEELYNTVTKMEFSELKQIVRELAEAQKRTEIKVEELTGKVGELVSAQKETDFQLKVLMESHKKLIDEHSETRKQLGGLSRDVGFNLENQSYKALPLLLEKDYGIKIRDRLIRDYLIDKKGELLEINILGKGIKDGKDYLIIGESKCHLSKNDINRFISGRLKRLQGFYKEEIFPLMVTHMVTSPPVRDYARDNNIALYYSYDF